MSGSEPARGALAAARTSKTAPGEMRSTIARRRPVPVENATGNSRDETGLGRLHKSTRRRAAGRGRAEREARRNGTIRAAQTTANAKYSGRLRARNHPGSPATTEADPFGAGFSDFRLDRPTVSSGFDDFRVARQVVGVPSTRRIGGRVLLCAVALKSSR